MKVGVVGGSGFVGSAVRNALKQRQVDVVSIRTPRLVGEVDSVDDVHRVAEQHQWLIADLAKHISGCAKVVNAGGIADAGSVDRFALSGANAVAPELIRRASRVAGVERLIHVSSSAVQGRTKCLDESARVEPFSCYSTTKALGERSLRDDASDPSVVVYRPTSVQGPDRQVTQRLARLARSPAATVAGDGQSPTPQALIGNVGDACAFLATCPESPPETVLHPWEGITTELLLYYLSGGKRPHHVPYAGAHWAIRRLFGAGAIWPAMVGHVRRLELMWFGQPQVDGWLSEAGWAAPLGHDQWERLGRVFHPAGEREANE